MGKKSSKEKSTTTSAPPTWAQPIIQGGAQSVMDNYKANQGNLNSLTSSLTNGVLPGLQGKVNDTSVLNPGQSYISGSLGSGFLSANPANQYLSATAGGAQLNSNPANAQLSAIGNGQYLNSNPYTQAMAKMAGDAAGNSVNATFSTAGRTGSGSHATELAKGVANAQNQVMFGNYQNERGLQQQALGQLGGNYNTAMGYQNQAAGMLGQNYNNALGIQSQNAGMLPGYYNSQFSGYTPLLGATQLAGQMPYYGSNSLGTIGSLLGNYGTQQSTATKPGGWGTALLGGLLAL